MIIPANLQERAKQQTSIKLPVILEVVLRKGSKVIDLNVHVDNHGLSHRLCILFDSALTTRFNYADQQFGLIKRPNSYDKEMKLYLEGLSNQEKIEKPKELVNWANDQSTWQEPPISIEPTQSYVALTDESRGIAVIPQGVREYEVIGEQGNQIRLTLFRTYGFMGKERSLPLNNRIIYPSSSSLFLIALITKLFLLSNNELETGNICSSSS